MSTRDRSARFPGSETACASAADVSAFADAVLAERAKPETSPTLDHLWECVICARVYGEYLALLTAPQLAALGRARDGGSVLRGLDGLLDVWRVQLGLCNLRDEAESAALALATMAMIHRARDDFEEAKQLLRLARRTAPTSVTVEALCDTELGYMALARGRSLAGLARGLKALNLARRAGDDDARRDARALVRRSGRALATRAMTLGVDPDFLDNVRHLPVLAEGRGEKVLLLEKASEIPITILDEPTLDGNDVMQLRIQMTDESLAALPHGVPCYLRLFLVPAGQVVVTVTIGDAERDALSRFRGLEIRVPLTAAEAGTGRKSAGTGTDERVSLPRGSWMLWLTLKNPTR